MYIYNATGVKLKKTVNVSITDYAGNYIYENDELQFFNHPEGYATLVNAADYDSGFDYVYQYKDHLGNIRLSYTDNNGNLEIVEENNYYPFGLKHSGYNNVTNPGGNSAANRWGYNGKELQDEDINGKSLDWYDFGARNYDAALGRWMNIDNLAEKHFNFSPYIYTASNPVLFVDYDGNDFGVLVDRVARTITIRATYLVNANNQAAFNRRGRDAYNNTSGQRIFVSGGVRALKQGRSQGYTVNFELQTQVDNNSNRGQKVATLDADQTGTLNLFETHPAPYRGLEDEK